MTTENPHQSDPTTADGGLDATMPVTGLPHSPAASPHATSPSASSPAAASSPGPAEQVVPQQQSASPADADQTRQSGPADDIAQQSAPSGHQPSGAQQFGGQPYGGQPYDDSAPAAPGQAPHGGQHGEHPQCGQYGQYGHQPSGWAGTRRLVRTRDRMLGGVCGGVARQFNLDPTVVRILAVIAVLLGAGSPILLYIIFWAIIPSE